MKRILLFCIVEVHDSPPRRLVGIARLLLCALLTVGISSGAHAQQQRVTISLENVTMEEAVTALGESTGASFLYNSALFAGTSRLSLKVTDQALSTVLQNILWREGLDYDYNEGVIVIKKRAAAQNQPHTLSGTVLDSNGAPLPGATVMIKGTRQGVSSDASGRFSLHTGSALPLTLSVSFIGYQTREVAVNDAGQPLRIALETDITAIDEVTISTGYANINRNSHTGSAVVIKREELLLVSPTNNIMQSLQVFDPSFKVVENNARGSDPNNVATAYIRGRSGLGEIVLPGETISETQLRNDPNLPTFILDGYEVSVEKVFDLDPSRVESISILKDAASTAIYGSRAANGVVVIETIKPKAGQLRLSYSFTGSVSTPDLSGYDLLNAREKLELERIAGVFEPKDNELPAGSMIREQSYYDKLNQINRGVETDWMSKPLHTAWNHRHNILIEGGSEEFLFGIDLKLDRTNGVMKGSKRNGNAIGFSVSYRHNNLMFRNYIEWNNISSADSPYGSFSTYAAKNPYDSPYGDDGKLLKTMTMWYGHPVTNGNPLYDATLRSYDRTTQNEISNNFNLKWQIFNSLRLDARMAISHRESDNDIFVDPLASRFDNLDYLRKGSKTVMTDGTNAWDANAFLMYSEVFGKSHLNASLGANAREQNRGRSSYSMEGFLSGTTDDINFGAAVVGKPLGSTDKNRSLGFFASANYTWDNIYLLDFSGRYDGASQFGDNVRFAPFWSLGAGINIHNYRNVKQNIPWLDNLKVRANYGLVGKAGFAQSISKSTYQYLFAYWYVSGLGATMITLANPDLEWEKTNVFDVGIDLSLFGRLSLSATYYHKKTVDLIGDITLPLSTGFASYKENLGEVLNEGFEVSLHYMLLKNRNYILNIHATLGSNTNKFLKISDSLREYNLLVEEYYRTHKGTNAPLPKYYEGASQTAIYAMKSLGINPADGREAYLMRDGTPTFVWDQTEHVVVGDAEPKIRGAFGFNFSYRSFYIYTAFLYEYGGYLYNSTLVNKVENASVYYNVDRRVFTDRWQKPGDRTMLKGVELWNEPTQVTSRFVQKNNYIDLSSITIGYTFSRQAAARLGMEVLKVSLTSNDLARISTIRRERGTSYPFARTISFSLNMNF